MHITTELSNFDYVNNLIVLDDTYSSISAKSEGLFKDLGSRFISFAFPVETEEEVKEIVASIKKEYHDARHHCYAYRLGPKGERFRANDDGEPSSSAGRPILGQIDSAGLSDVLVVVVRYFGGIKLGIPGLIRAYKTSTRDAIDNAEIVTKIASTDFMIDFGYLSMNAVMKVAKDLSLPMSDQDFSERCRARVRVRNSLVNDFKQRIFFIEDCKLQEIG